MMRGLLEKELRQHGFTLAFLGLLLLGGLTLITGHGPLRRVSGGGFAAVHLLNYTFIPLACLVLGQVLIATEFRQKTQLFLEGLPLPRWRMLAVKFALGLVAVMVAMGLALGLAWWRARHSEAMTPRFALLLGLKSLGWVWFFYTLCFAHAFLGRYRVIFGVALGLGLLYATQAGVELSTFGPFALMDGRFAYERLVLPERALAITAALGLALAALGFALGLVRDASVAALLSEKMSAREKVMMTLIAVVGLMVGGYVIEQHQAVAAAQMPGAVEAQRGVVRVLAAAAVDAPSRAETAALETTARRTAEALGEVVEYLGCRTFPPVFIVHRRDFGPEEFGNGELKAAQGVLVRANLTGEGFRDSALQAWLLRETLLAQSSGLAGRERNAWVLDGFLWWWPQAQGGRVEALDDAARTAARAAMPADFGAAHLRAWFSLRQKMGPEKARALAGSGLAVLAQRRGGESQRRFLAAMLAPARPADVRGWVRDVWRSPTARLRTATGWSEADLLREWRAALAEGTVAKP